ncbi:MAG: hypothetical protein D3904_16645 [Candidatus Electrothrix sp. EH2]|nr:hypothetical protein [Candidatus Electrothrix sp. EH2]
MHEKTFFPGRLYSYRIRMSERICCFLLRTKALRAEQFVLAEKDTSIFYPEKQYHVKVLVSFRYSRRACRRNRAGIYSGK